MSKFIEHLPYSLVFPIHLLLIGNWFNNFPLLNDLSLSLFPLCVGLNFLKTDQFSSLFK